jgi:hypothetical protein
VILVTLVVLVMYASQLGLTLGCRVVHIEMSNIQRPPYQGLSWWQVKMMRLETRDLVFNSTLDEKMLFEWISHITAIDRC